MDKINRALKILEAATFYQTDREALATLRAELAGMKADAERLDWLDSQKFAYGFEDMHEGNRWEIEGPFSNVRSAIDRISALDRAREVG